ncbi:MAG: alpha/beta hydrolase [Alphaproteobacteria bacterium]|nr:alpha/beta hydrolase [Alphaproteobacteria bacterium]
MSFSEKQYFGLNSEGFHRIIYNDWGDKDGIPVICVHGLTGNGHDFDFLAKDLCNKGYRLIAVDLPGRGRSDFLPNPLDYTYAQYTQDLTALLAHLGFNEPASVDWIGVSLGGLLGIYLAGMKNSPIGRLILNDVGPVVPKAALEFIYTIISQTYHFDTINDLEKWMRKTRGLTWGHVTNEQWKHMAEHNARALDDSSITYSYDPKIAIVFENNPTGEFDLWEKWDNITCPVHLIQGKKSLILTKDIIKQMQNRGAGLNMDVTVFKDCGHVPSLMAPKQIKVIEKWLTKPLT